MNYIITKNKKYFEKIGKYNYCDLTDLILPDIIGIDTETNGLQPRHYELFCVQIGTGDNNYIIDLYTSGKEKQGIFPLYRT